MFKNNWTVTFVVNVQFLSRVPTLCDPMNHSTPGFPVLHHLLALDQTHVHWVSDAIQPSHPLWPPSPAFNLSQHHGLFQWVHSSHQVATALALQHQVLPMNIQGWFILGLIGLICMQSNGLSRVFTRTTVQIQFFSAQPFLLSSSYIYTWLLEKPFLLSSSHIYTWLMEKP